MTHRKQMAALRHSQGVDAYTFGAVPESAANISLLVKSVDGVAEGDPLIGTSGIEDLYMNNREWAEEQAQKQMDFQTSANKIAMDFSAAEAAKERAFETEMANTAYQRAVADLKKAGLNPILAYSQGGASVPSVSSAQGVSSAGAKATSSDQGYTPYQLEYAYKQMLVTSATKIATSLIGAAAAAG